MPEFVLMEDIRLPLVIAVVNVVTRVEQGQRLKSGYFVHNTCNIDKITEGNSCGIASLHVKVLD